MSWNRFLVGCWLLIGMTGNVPAQDSETAVRDKIRLEVRSAVFAGEIDKLEAWAVEYRTKKSKTPSGLWKLALFYSGIEEAVAGLEGSKNPQTIAYLADTIDLWQKKYPDSPSAKVVKGLALQKRAWMIRGNGYANTVASEAWRPFQEGIEQARAYFESVKASASIDPGWYCEMANIVKAQHWPRKQFDVFAAELLARHPDYHQAVFCTAEYLSPRWYFESAKALEIFADKAVEATRKEEGNALYARIYWAISDGKADTQVFGENFYMWPKIRAGFNDMIVRYPDPWNINHFAKFACLLGDKEQFAKLAERIGAVPLQSAMTQGFYNQCKALAGKS